MKITFKNVGQGDTIILEWNLLRQSYIGIIDCKRFVACNPVIDFLNNNKHLKIKFVALSHPHYDHYSGLLELLEYTSRNSIEIEYFVNSANKHTQYLKWAEIDSEKSKMLARIFHLSIEMYNNGQIRNIEYPFSNWQLELNDEFSIKSYSPSDEETRTFVKFVNYFKESHEYKCSQAANLLSTVFQISNKNSYLLLTSDAHKNTFQRLHQRNLNKFDDNLLLCQIPHHGSSDNHFKPFWVDINPKLNCPSVISAGEHKGYNHPDFNVVKDFDDIGYRIYSTNNVNGIRDFTNLAVGNLLSTKLDCDSELMEDYQIEGDHTFQVKNNRIEYQMQKN